MGKKLNPALNTLQSSFHMPIDDLALFRQKEMQH